MRRIVVTLMFLSLLVFGATANAYDVYKDTPNPVPDVDKVFLANGKPAPGDMSCWQACAANLLGGGGWGTGATVQARADNIYRQMTNAMGKGRCGYKENAINWWLYTYGLNPNSDEYQPDNRYTDVTAVYKSSEGLDCYDYNFLLDELDRCQYVSVGFREPAHCLTMVGGNYTHPPDCETVPSVWHDSDRDLDGKDDAVYDTIFNYNGFDLNPTSTDPNAYYLEDAVNYVTLCPGLRKPDVAVSNYDVAYFGRPADELPDNPGTLNFDPDFLVSGEKADVYGCPQWEGEEILWVPNEPLDDMYKEVWLLVDYVDRVAGRQVDIVLVDDAGNQWTPEVEESEDGGQLLFHWTLDYQPSWENIIFPDGDYFTLYDPYEHPDVMVKDWNLATRCVPEPSVFVLLVISGLLLGVFGRRRSG